MRSTGGVREVTSRTTSIARILHFLVYLAFLAAGVIVAVLLPAVLSSVAPHWQVYTCGAFWVFGSAGGLAAVITDRPWFESWGLPLLILGTLFFGVSLVVRVATGQAASPTGSILMSTLMIALAGLLGTRLYEVRMFLDTTPGGER
jgi:hypothetical protein